MSFPAHSVFFLSIRTFLAFAVYSFRKWRMTFMQVLSHEPASSESIRNQLVARWSLWVTRRDFKRHYVRNPGNETTTRRAILKNFCSWKFQQILRQTLSFVCIAHDLKWVNWRIQHYEPKNWIQNYNFSRSGPGVWYISWAKTLDSSLHATMFLCNKKLSHKITLLWLTTNSSGQDQ